MTGEVNSGQWTDGKFDKGLIYDGSQYSKIPYTSLLDNADTDTWHHLALTYDGKDIILYLDGKQVAKNSINKGKIDYVQKFDFIVGANINHGSEVGDHFKGIVEEMRIYGHALYSFDPGAKADGK